MGSYSVKSDIIPLLENLVSAIQPFARANSVSLEFLTSIENLEISHDPELIIPEITKIICRIITLTPQEYDVKINVLPVDEVKDDFIKIHITNTGANLELLETIITKDIILKVSLHPRQTNGSKFEIRIPLIEKDSEEELPKTLVEQSEKYVVPNFYRSMKKNLALHFTNIKNLEIVTDNRNLRDGVFLKKVNAIITANLDNEDFDMISLAKSLALSRSQLHRRLKSVVGYAPARYIKYVRLQKAKEMLEKEDVTIGDVAFRTGFMSQSHFTRAFYEKFGFNPSYIKQNQ